MRLPRLHLVELEDLAWWPAAARDLATDYLRFMSDRIGAHRTIAPLIAEIMRESGADHIVDLCSGGGGPLVGITSELASRGVKVRATMTDRYPNLAAFRQAAAESGGVIGFHDRAVDARSVPAELRGLRTLFNGFHHFGPEDARAILRNAVESGEPISIFELSDRRLAQLIPFALLAPLIIALTTPLIRPFRWRRLVFTYLLPLVPLTCWWDGIVSQFRAYRTDELLRMAADAGGCYEWRAERLPLPTAPAHLTYLAGWPASRSRPDHSL